MVMSDNMKKYEVLSSAAWEAMAERYPDAMYYYPEELADMKERAKHRGEAWYFLGVVSFFHPCFMVRFVKEHDTQPVNVDACLNKKED